ncbi:Elongation factor Ts, mitochondrial [Perkinsus olseni]|uniref:Elongation factor Ts, mitochondrial n=1 Tax=Perkinsus olseni TaxID=32597 RepID=A0A7J6SE93_PEROL|nr:Elongation factor Ts, mitochondrial [Perkinsus olseni]KAF4746658.1 Elongation factor Ts, mitochondrial [Perkinsus olseni]
MLSTRVLSFSPAVLSSKLSGLGRRTFSVGAGGQAYKPNMALVQELRKRTGASISKCRDALVDEGGDVDKAMTWLKKRGIQSASEKTFRRAAEGVVAAAVSGHCGALVEMSCETDFVGRTPLLVRFARTLAGLVAEVPHLRSGEVETLLSDGQLRGPVKCDVPASEDGPEQQQELQSFKVSDALLEISSVLGENIGVRRIATIDGLPGDSDARLFHYVHSAVNSQQSRDVGKLASLVLIGRSGESAPLDNDDTVAFIGKVLAMQVVAKRPRYIKTEDVPEDVVEAERQIGRAAHLASSGGKELPEKVMDKILDGKMAKMRAEDTLYEMEILLPPSAAQEGCTKAETVGERLRKLGLVVQDFRFIGVGL